MAEITLEPTALSKVIPLSLKVNDVSNAQTGQLVTNKQFNTADTDAWFSFTLDGLAATTGMFDLTLINLQDKSVFNHDAIAFSTNPFYYKLDSGADELKNEIRHAGKWVGQLVVTLPNGDSATRKFIFSIEGHILDGTVVQTILLEDYNALISDIEASKDELTQYNIDYGSLIGTVTSQEATRVQAELTRAETFNALVDSEIIAQNIATELQNVEATFAPRMLSVEQQLEQIGNLDAETIPFLPEGLDAVEISVQDKLRPISLLENKKELRDFFKSLYTYQVTPASTRIGIACYGDSVGSHVWSALIRSLFQSYRSAALTSPAAGNNLMGASYTTTGTIFDSSVAVVDQTVLDGTGGFADFTYLPSAKHITLQDGATLKSDVGQGTGYSEVKCYLATGVGMGSAFVELLDDGGATLQSTTINLAGASLGATKAEFTTLSKTIKYKLRVTATGKVVHLLTVFLKPEGLIPLNLARGSSTLTQNNYASQTILQYLLTDLKVSLITLQCKEENINVSVPLTMDVFNTFGNCSKLVIGSLPDSGATPQRANNAIFRSNALANHCAYFDGFEAFGSYAELVRLGWQGDGTHPADGANQFVASLILGELGANFFLGSKEMRVIDNIGALTSTVKTSMLQIAKGDISGDVIDVIVNAGGGSPTSVKYQNGASYGLNGGSYLVGYGDYGVTVKKLNGDDGVIRSGWISTSSTTQGSTISGPLSAKDLTLTGAAVTTSANAGTNGVAPAQVANYVTIYVNGTAYKLPLYAL